jgi:hypothetical protein
VVAGSEEWIWLSFNEAVLMFRCSVCGSYPSVWADNVTFSQMGTDVIGTATIEMNGISYTDTHVFPSVTVGENEIPLQEWSPVSYCFIPSRTGRYVFYSISDFDPMLTVYDLDGRQLGQSDNYNSYNFYLSLDLEAGQAYRLEFISYDFTGALTTVVCPPYDINEDGAADTDDYDYLVSAALGDILLPYDQRETADLNGDGEFDVLDCRLLKLALAGKDLPT